MANVGDAHELLLAEEEDVCDLSVSGALGKQLTSAVVVQVERVGAVGQTVRQQEVLLQTEKEQTAGVCGLYTAFSSAPDPGKPTCLCPDNLALFLDIYERHASSPQFVHALGAFCQFDQEARGRVEKGAIFGVAVAVSYLVGLVQVQPVDRPRLK